MSSLVFQPSEMTPYSKTSITRNPFDDDSDSDEPAAVQPPLVSSSPSFSSSVKTSTSSLASHSPTLRPMEEAKRPVPDLDDNSGSSSSSIPMDVDSDGDKHATPKKGQQTAESKHAPMSPATPLPLPAKKPSSPSKKAAAAPPPAAPQPALTMNDSILGNLKECFYKYLLQERQNHSDVGYKFFGEWFQLPSERVASTSGIVSIQQKARTEPPQPDVYATLRRGFPEEHKAQARIQQGDLVLLFSPDLDDGSTKNYAVAKLLFDVAKCTFPSGTPMRESYRQDSLYTASLVPGDTIVCAKFAYLLDNSLQADEDQEPKRPLWTEEIKQKMQDPASHNLKKNLLADFQIQGITTDSDKGPQKIDFMIEEAAREHDLNLLVSWNERVLQLSPDLKTLHELNPALVRDFINGVFHNRSPSKEHDRSILSDYVIGATIREGLYGESATAARTLCLKRIWNTYLKGAGPLPQGTTWIVRLGLALRKAFGGQDLSIDTLAYLNQEAAALSTVKKPKAPSSSATSTAHAKEREEAEKKAKAKLAAAEEESKKKDGKSTAPEKKKPSSSKHKDSDDDEAKSGKPTSSSIKMTEVIQKSAKLMATQKVANLELDLDDDEDEPMEEVKQPPPPPASASSEKKRKRSRPSKESESTDEDGELEMPSIGKSTPKTTSSRPSSSERKAPPRVRPASASSSSHSSGPAFLQEFRAAYEAMRTHKIKVKCEGGMSNVNLDRMKFQEGSEAMMFLLKQPKYAPLRASIEDSLKTGTTQRQVFQGIYDPALVVFHLVAEQLFRSSQYRMEDSVAASAVVKPLQKEDPIPKATSSASESSVPPQKKKHKHRHHHHKKSKKSKRDSGSDSDSSSSSSSSSDSD